MNINTSDSLKPLSQIKPTPSTSKQEVPKEKKESSAQAVWNPDQHNNQKIPAGQAQLETSIYPTHDFKVSRNADGGASISFPRAAVPPLMNVIAELFPDAKEIKILDTDSTRPFSMTNFEIDGQPFHSNLLTGGIVAPSNMEINPGFFTSLSDIKLGDQKRPKTPLMKPGTLFPKGRIETTPSQSNPINKPIKVGGQALSISNSPPFKITQHGDKLIADGASYTPGTHPPFTDAILAAFPNAQNITLISENHTHPFSTSTFDVDGKTYHAQFLSGGFMPGKGLSIFAE